jgi:hypothetical protein
MLQKRYFAAILAELGIDAKAIDRNHAEAMKEKKANQKKKRSHDNKKGAAKE